MRAVEDSEGALGAWPAPPTPFICSSSSGVRRAVYISEDRLAHLRCHQRKLPRLIGVPALSRPLEISGKRRSNRRLGDTLKSGFSGPSSTRSAERWTALRRFITEVMPLR